MQPGVYLVDREMVRVEGRPHPLACSLILGVFGIGEDGEILHVPPRPAGILRRTGALPARAPGVFHVRGRLERPAKGDRVLPVVAEIVVVRDLLHAAAQEILDRNVVLVLIDVAHRRIPNAQPRARDSEIMHVAVLPAHRSLEDPVQRTEAHFQRDDEFAHDVGLHVVEGDLQLDEFRAFRFSCRRHVTLVLCLFMMRFAGRSKYA
jgi:hypothetical protein